MPNAPRSATLAVLAALLLPTLAHAVTYRFVKPQSRLGGTGSTHSGADTTDANAWSLCWANRWSILTPGMTIVLMPGDYSTDPTPYGGCGGGDYYDNQDLQNDISPLKSATGAHPDSAIRYMSYAYYATGDTTGINDYYVDGITMGGGNTQNRDGGRYATIIGVRSGGIGISKDRTTTSPQRSIVKWCYSRQVNIEGVNTALIYGCTISNKVGSEGTSPHTADEVVNVGGNNSDCYRPSTCRSCMCTRISYDITLRKCVIRADSMASNGKIFKIGGQSQRTWIDSCTISGVASPWPQPNTAQFGLWHDAAASGTKFSDNRWTLDMVRGQGGTKGDLSAFENNLALYWIYNRDSVGYWTFLRDTVNANLGAASGPGCGVATHWSAAGADNPDGPDPCHHGNVESCVFRGELAPAGWDAQYSIDHVRWAGNSFFIDSGGTPLKIASGIGSGNSIVRNTIVTRTNPTISLESSGPSVVPNPAQKFLIEGNIFARMRTTCVGGGSGAVAFMESPRSVPSAFIVDKNLYYSYTGAISQAVSWGASRGACVGQTFIPSCNDSCVGGGCASTPAPCWTTATTANFDKASRWGDPLFTDTTAALFSGNIRCYNASGGYGAAYGLLPDSAVGARQPQGAVTDPREPYEYSTDSLGRQVVIDTLFTSNNSITFKFIAPPDNALSLTGTPSEYLIAVSNFPIDASNFGNATTFATPPAVAAPGTIVSFTISATQHQVYFVAVRTVGSCGRLSPAVSVNGCAVARGSLVLCE